MSHIRVRFAPSPTGYLHIGSARTALYNWLYARKTSGAFILRIEDTDVARSSEEFCESILDALDWLGLEWDEGPGKGGEYGPYNQSARMVLYHSEARKLIETGCAYPCFCTKEEIEEMRRLAKLEGKDTRYDERCRNLPNDEVERRLVKNVQHVVRFKVPAGETKFSDIIRGAFTFNNSDIDDYVILKSDRKPTYNFAVVVDDTKMRISHVIRGDDHISNTPKQVLLYKALGYSLPKFAHLPMILGSDKSRLSKRHGATSVQEYRELGYTSDAVVNYLALLGWAYDDRTEIFTRESLVKCFSLKKVSKNPASLDIEKLNYINREHFKRMNLMDKVGAVYQALEAADVFPPDFRAKEWLGGAGDGAKILDKAKYRNELPRLAIIVKLMGNRLRFPGEAPTKLRYFYKDDYETDNAAYEEYFGKMGTAELLRKIANAMERLDRFDRNEIELAIRNLARESGLQAAELIHPCRIALTGQLVSPDVFSVIQLLGKEKCVERLEKAAEYAMMHGSS